MPNWCNNGVTISHEDPEKIRALADAMAEGRFLDHVIPVPQELKDTMAGSFGDSEKQALLEAQTARNIEQHGFGNWYDFCVAKWSTKWDVDCNGTISLSECGTIVDAGFDSAWAPPIAVYEELTEQGFNVCAYYYESGMGFVGKWEDGCDDCYELDGHDSSSVRAYIGEELDDYFGISENMAEWEEENSEDDELTEWYEEGVEKLGLDPHSEK